MSSPRGSPAPVLHGGWVLAHGAEPARFAIWGEEPVGRPRPRSMRKRKPLPHRPAPHPFALSDDGIRHALSVLGLTPWLSQGSVRNVAAWLPSIERESPAAGGRADGHGVAGPDGRPADGAGGRPVAGADGRPGRGADSRLAGGEHALPQRSTEPPVEPAGAGLKVWDVPAVMLDEVTTVVLLPRIAAASADHPTMLGDDLRAWIVAARFALSLAARQRLLARLQTVTTPDGESMTIARWAPVVDDPDDRANLRAVERAIPLAGLALAWEPGEDRPTARDVLADFVAAAIDGVARRARAPHPPLGRRPGPADAWLSALAQPDPLVALPEDAAQVLRRAVSAWSELAADAQAEDAFRLCFRLVPPESSDAVATLPRREVTAVPASQPDRTPAGPPQHDGLTTTPLGAAATSATPPVPVARPEERPWRLDYLLQATDDPSLLVPIAEVWRHRGAAARFLTRRFDQPQERVLAALGRASRLFGPIEASLREPRPEGCSLATREAADLVRDRALLLKASGFGVLLPGLDSRLNVRLRLRAPREPEPSKTPGLGVLSFDTLVAYDWQLALGDQPLSHEEFEMLARLKEPLVQLRGRWVDVRLDQIERALAFIQRHQSARLELGEALATALAPTTLDGVPVAEVQTTGWLDSLLQDVAQGAAVEPAADPAGFQGHLRPYQQRGLSWLATLRRYRLGALLADDMGLGKTAQVIGLVLKGPLVGPTLVICPTSVVGNWRHEIARFGPRLRVLVHHGATRAAGAELAMAAEQHDVVLSTYALLHRDEASLTAVAWDGLVLDEAQNIKNASTRAAQAARAIRSRWRVALTGTPVENRLADLWSIFQVINPGYLGAAEEFRRQFALPIERASDASAIARLKALTAPFILRRVKTDRSVIADLPEKQEMKVYCSLTREQATLYEAVVHDVMRQIAESEGIRRRGLVLGLLTKLKQVCDHPALLLHDASPLPGRSGKLARLGEMLDEVVAENERALIFTQYAEMGRLLQTYLAETLEREVLFLHGGTPLAERDRLVAAFQAETAGPPVFVLSLKAGGTGLNLTRANHVFHFDRWWNPAVENQATDRAFRIGQTRNVQVHKYVCAGTFEEALDGLIERKVQLAQSIVGTSEAWITELSTDELRNLFRLRREDAVAEDD